MRILHVLDHSIPLHSGYTFRTRNLLREQRALGWETAHVTGLKQGPVEAAEEWVEDLHFYRTPDPGGLAGRLPVVNQLQVISTLASRIDDIAAQWQPHIIHAHSPALNGLAALRAGARHGIPVVYECRAFWEDAAVDHGTSAENGLRYRLTRALESHVFRNADAVTTICEGLKADIVARGIAESRVTVIPNAVDTDQFTTAGEPDESLRRDLGLEGRTVLGFFGSFYAYEGLEFLLDCLPALRAARPDIALLLVGGGPREQAIRQQVTAQGLDDAVVLRGRVPHADMPRYYALADVLVYPRLPMRLTELVTPLKPLEAMAQGKVVLASDVGGHRELVRDGYNGRLFRAGDSDSLAAVAAELLADVEQQQRLRQAGRQFVETERTWRRSAAAYRDVFQRLRES